MPYSHLLLRCILIFLNRLKSVESIQHLHLKEMISKLVEAAEATSKYASKENTVSYKKKIKLSL